MLRRLNYRLLISLLLIVASATVQIVRERRPSFLRPGLRLYAFVGNAGDGTVSVVDLIRVSKIATILLVEQNLGVAHKLVKDVIVLDQGRVGFIGEVEQLMGDPALARHHLGVGAVAAGH